MMQAEKISEICKTALTESQFIVEIKINNANDIYVSIDDFNGLSIQECKRISRFVESQLDREVDDFSLELGSPGLSKPFRVDEQYKKALNTEVEVVLNDGEKFCGVLSKFEDDSVELTETKKVKVNNKKQDVEEKHIVSKSDIKTTKSIITFSKK